MWGRRIIGVLALVFFALPVAARVVGVKAHAFENHDFASRPHLSQGWDIFPQTTRFFTDRMPLREQAVKANRKISQTAFDTTPIYAARGGSSTAALPTGPTKDAQGAPNSEYALDGRDGWMYYGLELDSLCKASWPVSVSQATKTWIGLQRALERRGTRTVFVITPDKATIYPEHLPSDFSSKDCFPKDDNAFWAELERVRRPRFIPLRQTLLEAKRTQKVPVFLRTDTHWNSVGASYMVRDILRSFGGPVQMKRSDLTYGSGQFEGDLTRLAGHPATETAPTVTIKRPPGAPKVPGRTVIIGDSFALLSQALFAPYFEHMDVIWWYDRDPVRNSAALARADTVIIETAARGYTVQDEAMQTLTRAVSDRPPRSG